MKKRVYIALSHHHVVREWFKYRERGMHLLSFDYHTDFHEAFTGKSKDPHVHFSRCNKLHNLYLNKHIPCCDIGAAIKDLKNDEHIDFAMKSGIIKYAFVFSHLEYCVRNRVLTVPPMVASEEQVQIMGLRRKNVPIDLKDSTCHDDDISHDVYHDEHRIVSFPECRHPLLMAKDESQMAKLVTTDDVLNEVIKTFCKYGFDHNNYILDFDCDFIRDCEAMTHGKFDVLKQLIKGAYAITITQEPGCVDSCSKFTLSYEDVEAWLVKLIQDCECDPEIEYDSLALPLG